MVVSLTPADGREAQPPSSNLMSRISEALTFVLAQWLIIGFGLSCLLAYFFPNVAAHGGIIKSEYSILYGAVAFIFLVSGLQLSHQKLRVNLTNWRLHIVTQGISFILIPVIQTVIVHIVIAGGAARSPAIDISILVGMVVVSCLPTTIASNVFMTKSAGGDDAAAIIEVVIGNVFGSFISPGLIYAFLPSNPQFDSWRPATPRTLGKMYADVAMQLGLSVLVPLLTGQILRAFWPLQVDWALKKLLLAKMSGLCLVLLVWTTFSGAFQTHALYLLPKSSVIFNVFMNVATYMIFTLFCFHLARPPDCIVRTVNAHIADSRLAQRLPGFVRRALVVKRLPKVQTIAVCFCGAAKTTSLGIPLVSAMWATSDNLTRAYVQIPVLLYTIEQVFMAQMLVYFFRWYLRREGRDVELGEESEGGVCSDKPPRGQRESESGRDQERERQGPIDDGQGRVVASQAIS